MGQVVGYNPKEVFTVPEKVIKTSEYELVTLFRPELEAKIAELLEKVAKLIAKNGGKIVAEDDWGRRELAYPIEGETHAIYRVYTLELPAEAPEKISAVFNITNEIVRYLLTKIDPKVKEALADEKTNKTKQIEETETE